jgi:hypothetical protein
LVPGTALHGMRLQQIGAGHGFATNKQKNNSGMTMASLLSHA